MIGVIARVDGDLGLGGRVRHREADQRTDHRRIEHEHADEQWRSAQDPQVFEQQPAHR